MATAYGKTFLTIRSILRREAKHFFFVVASKRSLSNGQLSARCNGRYSSDPQASKYLFLNSRVNGLASRKLLWFNDCLTEFLKGSRKLFLPSHAVVPFLGFRG